MKIRTTRPTKKDKHFVRTVSGGYSKCVQGKPTDKECDTLANCVGYANGAYNEEHGYDYEKYHFICNAEKFIEVAIAAGLSVYQEPMPGGILVWRKGATLSGSDGAGHVAIPITEVHYEAKAEDDWIETNESSYGGTAWFKAKRKRGKDGNWGAGKDYYYRGCIAPEGYKPTPVPTPTPEPTPSVYPIKHTVVKGDTVSKLCTKYYGKSTKDLWNLVKDTNKLNDKYTIKVGQVLTFPNPNTKPATKKFNEGDKVVIVSTGNSSSLGVGKTAWGLGWTRTITKIWEDRPYPYQVGTPGKGTTGYYKADALQKK